MLQFVLLGAFPDENPDTAPGPNVQPQGLMCTTAGVLYTQQVVSSPGAVPPGNVVPLAFTPLDVESAATGMEGQAVFAANFLWNGADSNSFVRAVGYSADNMNPAANDPPPGIQIVNEGPEWSLPHTPAVGVRATITQAAQPNSRHVCKAITATLAVAVADVAVAGVLVNLRDGATGAGTILWSDRLAVVDAAGGVCKVAIAGLNIVGSENTAMTLEFAAAPGGASFESVTLTGRTADAGV